MVDRPIHVPMARKVFDGGDMVSTGTMERKLRAEDPGGLVKNRESNICQRRIGSCCLTNLQHVLPLTVR